MIGRNFLIFIILFFNTLVFAQDYTYHEVREWHFDRIRNVLKINSVEKRMDFALDIYRVTENVKSDEKEQVKLPGLLLNKPESKAEKPKTLFSENDVNHFKRILTLINLNAVEPEVVQKIKDELTESLYLSEKDSINVVISSVAVTEVQKTDAFSRIYDTMAEKSLIMWILLLSCLTLFTLWELKKILMQSAEKISESIAEMQAQKSPESNETEKNNGNDSDESNKMSEAKIDIDYKPEISILVANFYSSIQKHPGHLLASIYKVFDDQESMVKLFSYLDQSEVTEDRRKVKEAVLEFMKEHILFVDGIKIVSADIDIMPQIKYFSDVLTALKFLKISQNAEKLYLAVFLKSKNKYNQVVEAFSEKYFNIIYFLFPDELKSMMKKDKEILKSYSQKIISLVSRNQNIDNVNDFDIKNFMDDVIAFDFTSSAEVKGSDNPFARMLYYLSDKELEAMENESNRDLIHKVPKVSWLRGSDRNVLKEFIVALAPVELKLFSENVNNFSKIIKNFDPRTEFRLKETLLQTMEIGENTWFELRLKIAKFYSAPEFVPAVASAQDEQIRSDAEMNPPLPPVPGTIDETKKAS